jgi:adenine-specific DNA-methyltransferase
MRKAKSTGVDAKAYVHDEATRLNNPEAGNLDRVPKVKDQQKTYCWDPRESPQLIWAGKAGVKKVEVDEQASFDVPVVNLHIHERVSPQAIVRSVKREDAQRSLFADTELDFTKEIQFYQHEVNWANRMILGDSLQVMTSLLEREGMRGKVQMIYLDPPYGIKFGSNFQPRIDKRDVKDGADADLTREVEQVQAFRDTWELGVHSYLSYLRDRLLVSRELLSDSGSIFVQIGDENVHRVRSLLDEVFGDENWVAQIAFGKTSGMVRTKSLAANSDYLLWYARSAESLKFRRVYRPKRLGEEGSQEYFNVEIDGTARRLTEEEKADTTMLPRGARVFAYDSIVSGGQTKPEEQTLLLEHAGRDYRLQCGPNRNWKAGYTGTQRLWRAGRLARREGLRIYKRYFEDFPFAAFATMWADTRGETDMNYVVQTSRRVIERCILMTTDPGELVLDPTCGSGTTACVAEQWGRRWVTCDTSRVAVAIARHRLMTAAFDYYKLRHPASGIGGGLKYKTVPHIMLQDIAANTEIDAVAAEYQPQIDAALVDLRSALGKQWQEWEVPRPSDGEEAEPFVAAFWRLKREMQARIDASIQRNAPPEELVDQPEADRSILRVSGPFTVEAVPNVSEVSVEVTETMIDDHTRLTLFEPVTPEVDAANVSAYIGDMIEKLRRTGVVTKGKGRLQFANLRALSHEIVHAEGELAGASIDGASASSSAKGSAAPVRCAVVFGPSNGSVGELLVKDALDATRRYDAVLFCGYDFTGAAQERLRIPTVGQQVFMAYIAPDTVMTDLLKDTKESQLFTMVGEPDVVVYRHGDPSLPQLLDEAKKRGAKDVAARALKLHAGEMFLELRGVDLYDPVKGEVATTSGADIHAIFVDHDYDTKSFCICQALFPNRRDSWDKVARALKASLDEDAFEALRTQVTLPFKPGANGRVQVKVIDNRGNAVVKTVRV